MNVEVEYTNIKGMYISIMILKRFYNVLKSCILSSRYAFNPIFLLKWKGIFEHRFKSVGFLSPRFGSRDSILTGDGVHRCR